jgi:hypothetical protein
MAVNLRGEILKDDAANGASISITFPLDEKDLGESS